jgi:UDP-N-acetylglucosamine--N-acetylmuramyl-(pentapeptide) pyrophosphoryl-undecaprenol N-acetylglucosamine transferase
MSKKILMAAGGTGGHLFPAQALAEQLLEEDPSIELFFAGARLSTNTYLDRERFRFYDVASATPFRGSVLKALLTLLKGVKESYALLSKEKPTLVVGFGSFHVFPLLLAAVLKRVPLVLFESNAIPGKVVRLFSKRAKWTGIYFSTAKEYLNGEIVEVEIPSSQRLPLSKQQACEELHLDPHLKTLLVFGGSQGAQKINQQLLATLPLLKQQGLCFQLIHLTGCSNTASATSALCQELAIPCYSQTFEKRMDLVWAATDFAICRAGAMTLSELLCNEVPSILIPYPTASDQHQLKNARFMQTQVGGATVMLESEVTPELLCQEVIKLSDLKLKTAIKQFKAEQKKEDFCKLILRHVRK